MRPEEATAYTSRCFRGEPASCSYACPFRLDVRSLMEKVSKGRWTAAHKALRDATVFPAIVSALCDQPCRDHCQRTLLGDEAISVRDLEVACLRYAKDCAPQYYAVPPKDQRVAVVGAGTAGLSCALDLAQKRYAVTVFERQDGWGGVLRSHPRFAEFEADIALQLSGTEIDFRYGTMVRCLDGLADFEAVYVATGAGGDPLGVLADWDAHLFTTSLPRLFAGGMLCGATLMEGIAQGLQASKTIEGFLQTGRAVRPYGDYDQSKCDRYLVHPGATSVPRVEAADPSGYSREEAVLEATRCLQCDCDACLVGCEMLRRFRKDPHMIATRVHADMEVNPPFSVRTVTREVYSCNICGYCTSVCPEGVDMGGLLRFSRAARMSAGVHPSALHEFWLREMDFATTDGAFASAAKGEETCEYAFYPGCQLGAADPDYVLKSYAYLSEHHGAGIILGCCGAPAYWAGDEARVRANATALRQTWQELGEPTLVFACATCANLVGLFLPEIPRLSLYELLAASVENVPSSSFSDAVVFDPCSARADHGMEASVRALVSKAGVVLDELEERNRCCGYGGHMRLADPGLHAAITQHRAEASEKPYVVYCANCKEVFASRGKECAHVLDLAFGLPSRVRLPSLQEKRENSLSVKGKLMKQIRGVDFEPASQPWDRLTLSIGDELQRSLDDKLIAASDLKEAIWRAERSCDKFADESDGMSIASMVKPVITYWVQYQETAAHTYRVVGAYCHRMRFERGE